MATTSNLGLTLLEVGQKEKEVTINTNMQLLDAILTSATVTTTNATPTTLPLVTAAFASDSTYDFSGVLVARNTATDAESRSLQVDFLFRRGVAAANSVVVGTPTVTARFSDTGTTGWTAAVTADTTNGKPQIQVTGEAAKNIKWVGQFTVTKVTG